MLDYRAILKIVNITGKAVFDIDLFTINDKSQKINAFRTHFPIFTKSKGYTVKIIKMRNMLMITAKRIV